MRASSHLDDLVKLPKTGGQATQAVSQDLIKHLQKLVSFQETQARIHECMYSYMYVRMYVCMHVCGEYVRMHVSVHAHTHIFTQTYHNTHTHENVYVSICRFISCIHLHRD